MQYCTILVHVNKKGFLLKNKYVVSMVLSDLETDHLPKKKDTACDGVEYRNYFQAAF